MIRRVALVSALTLAPLAAWSDPLPVYTPTRHVANRPSREQRLQVADAVAEVLGQANPEVLSGTETDRRLTSLTPAALACDQPVCVHAVVVPLHARGVALVRQEYTPSRSLRIEIDVVNPQGVVTAHAEGDEPVGGWTEAVALARVVAGRVATLLAAPLPTPPVPAETHPVAVATPVTVAPVPHVVPPVAPLAPAHHRRLWEMGLGGGLVGLGILGTTVGAVTIGRSGGQASNTQAMQTLYQATAADDVVLVLGIAAILGGAVLVVDGMRDHPVFTGSSSASTVQFGAMPIARGAELTAGGTF